MDHETATRLHISERYILGELSPAQRDEFEEHFCDCTQCMDDVWHGELFAANTKAVFQDRTAAGRSAEKKRWFDVFRLRPLPVLAFSGALNLALLAFAGYGVLHLAPTLESRLDRLERPEAAQMFRLRGASRGAPQLFTVTTGFAVLRLDLPRRYQRYAYSVEDSSGRTRHAGNLSVLADAEELNLTIPVTGLDPGDYKLKVTGADGAMTEEIANAVLRVPPK